jgi:HNH endonuclease
MKQRRRTPIEERYWAKVDRSGGADACWPWTGNRDKDGYAGWFWDGTYLPNGRGRYIRAARWAYTYFIGPIAAGNWVLHHCDNPPCMNPSHWFLGTAADNSADRDAKGRGGGWKTAGTANGAYIHRERMLRGEASPVSKLTEQQVQEIRARYAMGGVRQKDLAAEYGVVQALVSAIVRRKLWRHI